MSCPCGMIKRLASAEELLRPLEMFGMQPGLGSTRRLLAALGQPQERFSSVLIAGTNGKGSTAALLAAMATASGYRTGLYTSPHLESVEERLRIDGRAIESERLAAHLSEVLEVAHVVLDEPVTYFEALTVAASCYFAAAGVELAVVETGMGGRLDATNATEPVLSLMTSVALDHEAYLGHTLDRIVREKAGIFRPGRPALAVLDAQEAARTLSAVAAETGVPLGWAQERVCMERVQPRGWRGLEVELVSPTARYRLDLGLAGGHQVDNLVLAVAAAEELGILGWPFEPHLTEEAVAGCRWPGRCESVELGDGSRVVLDGAHNPAAARSLALLLAECGEPFLLLFGVLRDKDAGAMLSTLTPLAERVVLTAPPHPRYRAAVELTGLVAPGRPVAVVPEAEAALDQSLKTAPGLTVVCGSLYLVGAVRHRLRRLTGVPEPAVAPLFKTGGRRSESGRRAGAPRTAPV